MFQKDQIVFLSTGAGVKEVRVISYSLHTRTVTGIVDGHTDLLWDWEVFKTREEAAQEAAR